MQAKNVRNKSKVDETERVKLYKTHRGWCSSLSRFWTFLKAASVDEDDETSYEDYLKAIATICNGRQHAAAENNGFAPLNGNWSFIEFSKRINKWLDR